MEEATGQTAQSARSRWLWHARAVVGVGLAIELFLAFDGRDAPLKSAGPQSELLTTHSWKVTKITVLRRGPGWDGFFCSPLDESAIITFYKDGTLVSDEDGPGYGTDLFSRRNTWKLVGGRLLLGDHRLVVKKIAEDGIVLGGLNDDRGVVELERVARKTHPTHRIAWYGSALGLYAAVVGASVLSRRWFRRRTPVFWFCWLATVLATVVIGAVASFLNQLINPEKLLTYLWILLPVVLGVISLAVGFGNAWVTRAWVEDAAPGAAPDQGHKASPGR